jgi:hypothetical protein
LIVNTCSIHFHGYDARSHRGSIRWELFLDPNIHDVLLTESVDTLRIIFSGTPSPAAWAKLLTDAGFPAPSFDTAEPSPAGEPLAA